LINYSSIAELSDVQLLVTLCSTDDDKNLYEEFVRRFLPDLSEECAQICKRRKLDIHIGRQISHDTFERVRKYKTFTRDKINIPNDRKGVLVYLFRISTSLFNDYHKKHEKEVVAHRTYFDDILEPAQKEYNKEELKNIKDSALQMFNTLTEREKRVITKDLEFKRHQKYLPGDVVEELANELGIKKATVRKIRERAIEKLKKAANEISQR
jgi:RNA polymerase sigma factor (sigma-70 family)